MGSEQQERVTTPLPSMGISKQQRSKANLSDVTNTIKKVAQSYDSEYTELCHVLEEVADDVEIIKQHRMTNITALRDDIENLLNAVETARQSATDTAVLQKHREGVERLEREKQQVVNDILAGKDEAQDLKSKLRRVEQQIELVRKEREAVKDQTDSELPSLEYLKRVLQRLSHTYLTKGDFRTTEGFVCKKGSNDVRPFHFDESVSHFDQVNNLWKMISEE